MVCRVSFLNIQAEQTVHFKAVKEEVCTEPPNLPLIRGALPLPFLPARVRRGHGPPQPWGCDVLGGRAPSSIVGPVVLGSCTLPSLRLTHSAPSLQERPARRAGAHLPVPAPAAHVFLVHPLPPAPARVRRPQPADTG